MTMTNPNVSRNEKRERNVDSTISDLCHFKFVYRKYFGLIRTVIESERQKELGLIFQGLLSLSLNVY